MSKRITKAMRNEFLNNILGTTFHPQFEALKEEFKVEAQKKVEEEHPHFIRGRKDQDLREYIQASEGLEVKVGDVPARMPCSYAHCDHKVFDKRFIDFYKD